MALFVVFEERRVGKRAGFHTHGFVTGEVERFELIELFRTYRALKPRPTACVTGFLPRSKRRNHRESFLPHRPIGLHLDHFFGARYGGVGFGKFEFAGEVQVQLQILLLQIHGEILLLPSGSAPGVSLRDT